MKKALVTGITGQDGSYLAELLLDKGYQVHGIIRRTSTQPDERIQHLLHNKNLELHMGDLADASSVFHLIKEIQPDECYNLAAQSHVRESFDIPEYTGKITGMGPLYFLEAIRKTSPQTKFYQASSSEMFGKVHETPQTESTPFHPRSPYGVAKVYAFWITVNYRESYNLFAVNGILFNHESPRRGETFVTKKITKGLVEIKNGQKNPLELGNLDAKRDWGYAEDYVEAMWKMLQHDEPEDFVIATGETHSVREFVEEACSILEIPLEWKGSGLDEIGINKETGQTIIKINKKYFRPAEVDLLIGNFSKAKNTLGWFSKTTFKELVRIMIEEDQKGIS
ncbi:MAG: GDP-mannose 4,6-dehydratase [Candidatus Kerfeldbacteria bacterium CG08_land_8_20_14_0_20_42_7]|uniref:GDP-mannose 4,6-dehydratase n=1 Tax=Candidatus Kerfeldbacteria bacterium CG08_land_8_20_14_0_20_42_7 TaxID=2014245 RepID=A0A2H0YT90_9BACT|nr:MAG: GDP-mannose 4,6-dehydratase [Candidatus Kerfeldbacteria bacterium CG08_land_8_20_14_0_20_42_7]